MSITRFRVSYWKGDDLLFRPILFTWLAIANRLFSYHHVWWNMANVALHVGVAVALLRLLLAIHPSLLALPAAVLFLVLEPPMELVLWNHLGGYLLACLFLAIGLRSFVRRLDGSTTSNAGFAIAFTLACLSYEAMVPIAAAAALILFVKQRRSNRGGDAALLAAPVALYAVLYSFHALHAPRLGYVDRADGRTPFDLANIGSVLNGIQRMLEAWIRELAMPTALRLWAAPFERFGKNFHIALSEPFQILNLVVVLARPVCAGAHGLAGPFPAGGTHGAAADHRDIRLRVHHRVRTVGRRSSGDHLLLGTSSACSPCLLSIPWSTSAASAHR